MNKEFLIALAAILGVTLKNADEPTAEDQTLVQNALTTLANGNAANVQLLANNEIEITRLKGIETTYNAEKATFADAIVLKAFKDNATAQLRAQVLANYTKLAGDKPQAAITEMINSGTFETLSALNIQYSTQLDEKFPISCGKCGSTEINRASSSKKKEVEKNEVTDNEGLRDKLRKKNTGRGVLGMHGKQEDEA